MTRDSGKTVMDRYFLEERNPYSKRRPIKTKNLAAALGVLLVLFILGVIFFASDEEKRRASTIPNFAAVPAESIAVSPINQSLSVGQDSQGGRAESDRKRSADASSYRYRPGSVGAGRSLVNRSADQVIRRGAGSDPGASVPLGTTIPMRLLNAVLSTDTSSPVLAEVTEDVMGHGAISIPSGTRAIGSAQYDESSQRIQIRFHAFVYPDGDQHAVQALALMPDGSSGLQGEYHSGEGTRNAGRLLGHFVSGMADGMKERRAAGQFGATYEPGSLRNGVLNGLTLSAQDEAKSLTERLTASKASMTLAPDQPFLLFFEREYTP